MIRGADEVFLAITGMKFDRSDNDGASAQRWCVFSPQLIEQFYLVTRTNSPAFEDIRPKPASMNQWLQDVLLGDALEIPAGFTESVSSTDGITDTESLADEVIECGVSGDDIPPMFAGSEFDICLALDPIDGFSLDQCQIIAIGAFLVRPPLDEGSRFDFAEIPVTSKATSSDGLDVTTFSHLDFGLRSSKDTFDSPNTVHTTEYYSAGKSLA